MSEKAGEKSDAVVQKSVSLSVAFTNPLSQSVTTTGTWPQSLKFAYNRTGGSVYKVTFSGQTIGTPSSRNLNAALPHDDNLCNRSSGIEGRLCVHWLPELCQHCGSYWIVLIPDVERLQHECRVLER